MAIVDYFLKIDGIAGESTDEQHKDELDVSSWSWGVTQTGTMAHGSGGGEGKASFNDFNFTHHVDKSSPVLLKACATGQHIKQATLTARKSGGETNQEFLKLTISDVLVSSYRNSGASVPTRQITTDSLSLANLDAVSGDTDTVADAVSLRYAKATLVEGPQQRIHVSPAATGVLSFDPQTGAFEIKDTPNGVMTIGTGDGIATRGVQEFDVSDVLSLLNSPFGIGSLTLTVNEVRPTPPPTENPTESVVPQPTLHFDVLMYAPADGALTPEDLTRKGKRLGSLHLDPRGGPTSLGLDLTKEVREAALGTFGIRLQLRGAPIPPPDGDTPPPDPEFQVEEAAASDERHGRNVSADFTVDLVFDTA